MQVLPIKVIIVWKSLDVSVHSKYRVSKYIVSIDQDIFSISFCALLRERELHAFFTI